MLIYIKAYFKRNLRYIESYTIYILITFQKSMLLTQKHLRAGDFEISVFRSPGKGVPIKNSCAVVYRVLQWES